MKQYEISSNEFLEKLSKFAGRKVADIWFSDYSIAYIEFGKVIDSNRNHPQHEYHIFLGYDWFLKHNSDEMIERLDREDELVANLLKGSEISQISITDNEELRIYFESGAVIESRSSDGEGPEWDIREFSEYTSLKDDAYILENCR